MTTHNRGQSHSAVAAAAYRLGIKLFDQRTGVTHDYTRRTISEGIAAGFTVAPPDAPAWVHDPGELWNRVESCEKRKDAQIARDYVLPVPLGFDQQRAVDLADRIARYISDELAVPVTVAIHRNSAVDLQGREKEPGFHAHLLFPTRRLLAVGETAQDEPGLQGFGAKLTALSNRRTSSGIIERLNAAWAEAANDLSLSVDLPATYDHRSYARLGIDRVPQPRLTQGQVALVKKGLLTVGDTASHIVLPSAAYEVAHPDAVEAQKDLARADVEREAAGVPPAELLTETGDSPDLAEGASQAQTESARPTWALELTAARHRSARPDASLADRFVAQRPWPETDAEGERLLVVSGLVWAIQRALRHIAAATSKLAGYRDQLQRWTSARLAQDFEMDQAKRRRQSAERRAREWSESHRWKVWASRVRSGRDGGQPRMLRSLAKEIEVQTRFLMEQNAAQKQSAAQVAELKAEEADAVAQLEKAEARLAEVATAFQQADGQAWPVLLSLVSDDQRQRLAPYSPEPEEAAPPVTTTVVEEQRLVMERPRPRPRP